ncbi:hypothetical protein [Actinomadura parmotrematis]|uniref:MarR family transcriptional regulator n=1 Tax=Actinomadura parmotrematis TaxID=2864039 RepID=A0ABS7G483_9ACTN|nr:hypothetical protein [Actinomadura parmotrematis]MBW8486612.1 hypothetical protein [Actinomadura parmotrematis]
MDDVTAPHPLDGSFRGLLPRRRAEVAPDGPLDPAPPAPDPDAGPDRPDLLTRALARRAAEGFTGTLVLEGPQSGTITLAEGRVVAASSPAAPGPESLILRSGRIPEQEWSEAYAAAAPDGRLAAELVRRGLLGATGVEVLTRTALADAVFAIALCGVRSCAAEPAGARTPPLLPAEPGVEAGPLLRDVARRLATAERWAGAGLGLTTRPRRADDAPPGPVGPVRRQILDRVDGRRNARDIAFTLGRGLYAVLADLADLARDGRIVVPR